MFKQMKIGLYLWLLVAAVITALLLMGGKGLLIFRQTMLHDRQNTTRNVVETAYGVVAHYGALATERKLGAEEARSQALAVLRGLRYQDGEYFWVNTLEPRMVMHPIMPEMEGQDLSDYRDPHGKLVFVESAKTAQRGGAGFVDYAWPKPGSDQPVAKVSYVKLYEPWGWVIGSGVYLDDVERAFESELIRFSGFALVALLMIGLIGTGIKVAGEALYRMNRELRAVSLCDHILTQAEDEQTLLDAVCRIVCKEAGYCLAWVGYIDRDDAKTLHPVARAGFEGGHGDDAGLGWVEDTEGGQGPIGRAIRSGEATYVRDFLADPALAPWHEGALRHGCRSGIALPLKDADANVFGALLVCSAEVDAIADDDRRLLEELSRDLAFGVVALRTRAERARADAELAESNASYRRIVNTASEGIWMIGPDLRTTFVNTRMAEMIGYSVEELVGRPFDDFIFEEDVPDHARRIEHRRQGLPESYERRFRRKDGQEVWTQASATAILDDQHRYQGSFAMFTDITERKHAEEALRKRNEELETFERLVVGRELRMVELKQRITQLNEALASEKEKDRGS